MQGSDKLDLSSNEYLVRSLVYKYLFPSICGLVGIRISGFVNSLLLGRILGSLGLSVVSLVNPVILRLNALPTALNNRMTSLR